MRSQIEIITPTKARRLLKKNPNNRELSTLAVNRIADQILRGAWRDNGASVVVSDSGDLLDGQHRLSAIVKSGVAIQLNVVRGVDRESFETIDTGRSRTLADVLHIRGIRDSKVVSTAVKYSVNMDHGVIAMSGKAQRLNLEEFRKYLDNNPDLLDSVEYVTSMKQKPFISKGLMSALHYHFSKRDPILADSYVKKITDGRDIEEGTVEDMVYNRLLSDSKKFSGKMHGNVRAKLMIRGWNLMRRGVTPTHIKVGAPGKYGAGPESNAPKII